MAGDSATAAALFGELLPAIGDGNIDLGQHELVDEVLSADLSECAARYLHAVYASVDPRERPDALLAAIDNIDAVACVWEPIEKMDRVATGSLPDLKAFLPAWVEKLRSVKPAVSDWEDAHNRRLREAITRAEGLPGLARLARTTRRPEVVRAWCTAVRETGDWKETLRAYEDAAQLVSSPVWRGDFLDGAALAAERLGRQDITERLEVAFRQAPSLVRLLRWLASGDPSPTALRRRASAPGQPPQFVVCGVALPPVRWRRDSICRSVFSILASATRTCSSGSAVRYSAARLCSNAMCAARWTSGFRHLSRLGDDLADEPINPLRVASRAPDPSRKITRTGTTEKSRDTSGRSDSRGPRDTSGRSDSRGPQEKAPESTRR